jgi:hypothetical protein
MTKQKLVVALALLLGAATAVSAQSAPPLVQDNGYSRPGPYFGNDYGPDYDAAQPPADRGTEQR